MKEKQMGASNKDWQPGEKQFAGKVAGKANKYMERTDATMNKEASKLRSQAYKGRYD
jgi:hypothetical protein